MIATKMFSRANRFAPLPRVGAAMTIMLLLAAGAAPAETLIGGQVADVPFTLAPRSAVLGSCELINLTTTLDTTAPVASPAYIPITGTQIGRLLRNATASSCAAPKTNPGLNDTAPGRQFDRYRFTPSVNSCVTVSLTQPATTLFAYAVSSFDPASPDSGYLADPGSSMSTTTFSLNVTAGVPIDVVVHEVNAGSAIGVSYSLNVSSDAPCPPDPVFANGFEAP